MKRLKLTLNSDAYCCGLVILSIFSQNKIIPQGKDESKELISEFMTNNIRISSFRTFAP